VLALFGTTISPYLFFWQAAEEVEGQARALYAVITASILVGVVTDALGVSPIRALYLAALSLLVVLPSA
jgi:Mn2+/Fe2+ NRAMP family transporter